MCTLCGQKYAQRMATPSSSVSATLNYCMVPVMQESTGIMLKAYCDACCGHLQSASLWPFAQCQLMASSVISSPAFAPSCAPTFLHLSVLQQLQRFSCLPHACRPLYGLCRRAQTVQGPVAGRHASCGRSEEAGLHPQLQCILLAQGGVTVQQVAQPSAIRLAAWLGGHGDTHERRRRPCRARCAIAQRAPAVISGPQGLPVCTASHLMPVYTDVHHRQAYGRCKRGDADMIMTGQQQAALWRQGYCTTGLPLHQSVHHSCHGKGFGRSFLLPIHVFLTIIFSTCLVSTQCCAASAGG